MKNAVLASLLFGACAVAAPFDKRALVYYTEVLTETVVVYTTVYEDEPVATSSVDGLFYEQPKTTSSSVVVPTSSAAPAYTPPVVKSEEPSSIYTPAPETPTPTPAAAPTSEAPKEAPQPTSTEAYVAPAPAATSSAAVEAKPSTGSATTSGETHSNVDITIYDNNGGYGACGTVLHDSDMIVALAQGTWGASTYDVMTGASTNPWCGQKIQIEYEGNSIQATIMDLCPGCLNKDDIDLSLSAWKALTGKDEKTRLKASWSKIA